MHALHSILCFVQVLIGIGLIYLIDGQNPKNEGIGGTISSPVQSSFKGKAGFEERLNELTKKVGVSFFVLSILVAVTAGR